jgi:TRAP-type mannitol/chloroaromatic compound transport system permease large subunit
MKHLTNGIFLFLIIIIVPRFPELAYSVDFDKIPTGEVDKLNKQQRKGFLRPLFHYASFYLCYFSGWNPVRRAEVIRILTL